MKKTIAIAAVTAVAGAANAVMSVEAANVTVPTQLTDIGPLGYGFDEFGALGIIGATLVGVEISLEGTISGEGTVTNNSVEDLDVELSLDGEVTVDTTVLGLGSFELAQVLPSLTNGPVTLSTGQSDTVGPDNSSDNVVASWFLGDSIIADAVVAEFAGIGTQTVNFTFDGAFEQNASSVSGQTDFSVNSTVNGAGGFVVTYYYEIPAPGAAGLLAVAGVAAARRRRA